MRLYKVFQKNVGTPQIEKGSYIPGYQRPPDRSPHVNILPVIFKTFFSFTLSRELLSHFYRYFLTNRIRYNFINFMRMRDGVVGVRGGGYWIYFIGIVNLMSRKKIDWSPTKYMIFKICLVIFKKHSVVHQLTTPSGLRIYVHLSTDWCVPMKHTRGVWIEISFKIFYNINY